MRIGWIGLGRMGVPMLTHIVKHAELVEAYNRTDKTVELPECVTLVKDVQAVVRDKDIVFVMVSDGPAVEDVLFATGACEAMKQGTLVVNMSTIGVDETKRISEQVQRLGLRYLEAPVLGSVKPAQDGLLTVVAGGDQADYDVALPLFELMSKRAFYLGEVGRGATMKLMVNSYLGIAVQAMAETLHFAETNGLEKAVALEVLSTSAVWSPMLAGKQAMVTSGQYDAQFALKHLTKDLGLTLRQATEHDTFVPAIERVHETFRSAVDSGYGDLDMSALVAFFEDRAK